MLQRLENMVQAFAQEIIKSGDTAFATAFKNKKASDCAQALYKGMEKIAMDARNGSHCVGVNPTEDVFKGAIVHWYTEDKPSIASVADILNGECDICGQGATPKAETPKADKPKASKPKAETPKAKPTMAIVPPTPKPAVPAPVPQVEDDDDEWLE